MNALDVAKYFLYKANKDGELITNLKLQKLLYYAQAWYLVNYGEPLFHDEIKAWKFGPAIESVYHQYKKFRHTPIIYKNKENIEQKIPTDVREFLDEFYNVYISYSAVELLQFTHNDDPWKEAFESSTSINIDQMRKYYTKQYRELIAKKS